MTNPKINMTPTAAFAQALEDYLSPAQVGKAVARGVNKAAVGIRAQLTTRLTAEFNISARDTKAALPITRATYDEPVAHITVAGAPLPLVDFVTKGDLTQLKNMARYKNGKLKPVKARIHKSKPKQEIPHAFYVGAYKTLVRRETQGPGSGRGPLGMLYGPSFASQARKELADLEPIAMDITAKRVREEINYEIIKAVKALK